MAYAQFELTILQIRLLLDYNFLNEEDSIGWVKIEEIAGL